MQPQKMHPGGVFSSGRLEWRDLQRARSSPSSRCSNGKGTGVAFRSKRSTISVYLANCKREKKYSCGATESRISVHYPPANRGFRFLSCQLVLYCAPRTLLRFHSFQICQQKRPSIDQNPSARKFLPNLHCFDNMGLLLKEFYLGGKNEWDPISVRSRWKFGENIYVGRIKTYIGKLGVVA